MDHNPDSETKRLRSKKAKVRTGCKTCKKRRVKCDEDKPRCKRCIAFGVSCDGYTETMIPPRPSGPKLLIPRLCHLTQQSPLCQIPSRSLFKSQQEHRYFQLFYSKTSYHLAGYFSPKFWRTLVLQACETDAPIRHAVVALGALNFASPKSNEVSQTKQRQFAFREYSKAISEIRKRIAGQKVAAHGNWGHQNLRFTLIACLLFACFEAFHGFLEAAIAQIHVGVRMIEEWLIALEKCWDMDWVKKKTSIASPQPNIIEDELIHIFSRLDLESLSSRKNSNAEWQHYQRFFGQNSMDAMPAKFADLTEARTYLELVERRAMHWMPWMEVKRERDLTLCFSHAVEMEISEELLLERSMMVAETTKWTEAFEPLWKYSQLEQGKSTYLGGLVLKIQGLVAHVLKSSVACSRQFLYETSTHQLKDIVDMVKILVEMSAALPRCQFSFDIHAILPLAVVGLRFRHRGLRQEVITLLLEGPWPWREGVWDSWVVGKAIKWVADIEDEGLRADMGEQNCEHVPENCIAKDVRMEHDASGRKTTVSCLQPVREMEGELIPRQVVIPWL